MTVPLPKTYKSVIYHVYKFQKLTNMRAFIKLMPENELSFI